MRSYVITILILTVLLGNLSAKAQEKFLFIFMPDDPSNHTYVNNIFYALQDKLSAEGFQSVRYVSPDAAPYLNLDVILMSNVEGYKMIFGASTWNIALSDVSPLLQNRYYALPTVLEYLVSDQESSELVVDFLLALSLYSAGECNRAVEYFTTMEKDFSHVEQEKFSLQASIYFYSGNCALLAGDYQTAANRYEASLDTLADRTLYLDAAVVNLAWTYLQLDLDEESFELFEQEINRFHAVYNPDWVSEALEVRAQLYALENRFDNAIIDLTRAIELAANAENYTLRGAMYLALFEWDSALMDFNTAIELNSAYPNAYYQRGLLYASILQTGAEFYDEALADFQHYLELAPEGEHAAEAAQYITDLQSQQQSLNE